MSLLLEPAGPVGSGRAGVPARADLALLRTKLAVPRVPAGYLPRPDVARLLDIGTAGPLTLVSAGAGWGKTLAVAAWAGSNPRSGAVAWVSLDSSDNHAQTFWSYVLGALRTATALAPTNPLARWAPGLGGDEQFLSRLQAGVEQLSQPVVLVLDDFHHVDDPGVLGSLAALTSRRLPQFRLVLITRSDPALPLSRLRVAGDLVEIRAVDLALTATHAAAMVAHDGVVLGPGAAEVLVDRTEGWPAGLRLAAMFLARDLPGHRPEDFGGNDQAVVGYLAEEVLARHPPEVQQFLMRTSVAEQLNASLAQALTGEPHAQKHLVGLAASNSFVVGLGPGQVWYRYHALLRQTLLHRLSVEAPAELPVLHSRAAIWFSGHGKPLQALHHAAEAQDWALMGRLLVTQALPLAVSVERAALDQVLSRIPTSALHDSPELAVAAATRLLYADRLLDIEPHLRRAHEQPPNADPVVAAGTRIALSGFAMPVARARGDNDALIATAARVLDEVTDAGSVLPAAGGYRATALANIGTGMVWAGRLTQARHYLSAGLQEAEGSSLDATRINMLSHLALAAAVADQLSTAERFATQAIELVEQRGWAPLIQAGSAHLALAIVHLQRGQVQASRRSLAEGLRVAAADRCPSCAMAMFEVRVDASTGSVDAAQRKLVRLRHEMANWDPPRLLARWQRITHAEVDLAAGDPAAALARVSRVQPQDQDSALVPERLVRARALLQAGDPSGADETLALLRRPGLRNRSRVERLLLTALVADRLRKDGRATQAAHRALSAAEPEGIRRPFLLWEPDHVPRLLERVRLLHPDMRPFIDSLTDSRLATASDAAGANTTSVSLTDRELSVLQYLPTMMTYPEIGADLFVSVNTVKSHLRHLYAKLEVANRRQAVVRGRELGILEP